MLLDENEADTASKQGRRSCLDRKKPTARSRVGNGKALLSQVDLRGVAYREYCDVASDLAAHMGGDPTAVERALLEEAAGFIVYCRRARAAMLRDEHFDVGAYVKAVNALRRVLQDIGQERRMRDVTPSISQYVKAFEAQEADTPFMASEDVEDAE
jgi:hypothetical protein